MSHTSLPQQKRMARKTFSITLVFRAAFVLTVLGTAAYCCLNILTS